jgi:hypothetical protein
MDGPSGDRPGARHGAALGHVSPVCAQCPALAQARADRRIRADAGAAHTNTLRPWLPAPEQSAVCELRTNNPSSASRCTSRPRPSESPLPTPPNSTLPPPSPHPHRPPPPARRNPLQLHLERPPRRARCVPVQQRARELRLELVFPCIRVHHYPDPAPIHRRRVPRRLRQREALRPVMLPTTLASNFTASIPCAAGAPPPRLTPNATIGSVLAAIV